MSEGSDVLSREVAITAKMDETGLSLRAKSRAVAAFDRLVGSIADWPTAFFEGKADKRRIKDENEKRFMLIQGEVAERKLNGIDQAGDELLIRVLKDEGRKQANIAGVAFEAIEEMKALPPPVAPSDERTDSYPDQIDDDWLNQFTRFAEDASSDQLQQLWGRVLAGEVTKPGSFSRHTLRFIAELDKVTAENCQFALEREVNGFIPKTEAWNGSDYLSVGLDLQRLGILEGLSGIGGLQKNFTLSQDPQPFVKGNQCLVLFGDAGEQVSVNAIVVTRLGQEIFSLLSPADPRTALRDLASLLEKGQHVHRLELGHCDSEGGKLRFFKKEVLFERQSASPNASS